MSNESDVIKPSHIAAAKLKVAIADRKGEEVPPWIRDLASRDISSPHVRRDHGQSTTTSDLPSSPDPQAELPEVSREDSQQAAPQSLESTTDLDDQLRSAEIPGDELLRPWTQVTVRLSPGEARLLAELSKMVAGEGELPLSDPQTLRDYIRELGKLRSETETWTAGHKLADLLTGQGRVDEAIAILRSSADAGDSYAARQLADLLTGQGRVDEAVAILRSSADAGGSDAARQLADLLAGQGEVADAIAALRSRADAIAAWRSRADAGGSYAARQLADLLAGQGEVDEAIATLRSRADAGDVYAAQRAADLLAGQGREDEAIAILRARIDEAGQSARASQAEPDATE